LNPVNTDSLGEQIQSRFPELKVVKALNTMNTDIMINPGLVKGDHNVFICENDEEAKNVTTGLLESFGWRKELIMDLGDISNSRGTEMILPIWLRIWGAVGTAEFNFLVQKN
ncbi:MAG: NADP oxidoreductase, partial [Flavobacteriales bacterium]|nr:NADP oxidoreductase [Flavobacteriales bacterium]